jgi:hypothetical protein
MVRRVLLLSLAFLSATTTVWTQLSQGWIEGRVREAAGRQGLEGVGITVTVLFRNSVVGYLPAA